VLVQKVLDVLDVLLKIILSIEDGRTASSIIITHSLWSDYNYTLPVVRL
jgi:hypothetical protein